MKKIVINGNNFENEEEFYTEIDNLITKNLTWKTGHNLNAFADLLSGGFGVHEYGEQLEIVWINAAKSKSDLGYDATVKHWEKALTNCHSTAIDNIKQKIEDAKNKTGKTVFDILVEIIQEADNCTLTIEE